MSRALPPNASVVQARDGAMLHAPSAERNADVLCDLLRRHAPQTGQALEIASGTGQHVTAYAQALPGLRWQPSEIDAARRASIDAYVADAALPRVAKAVHLNATQAGWAAKTPAYDLIMLANLLHLISETEVTTLIAEAALALAPKGVLILYGPFARDGVLTSDGDKRFDAQLRAADPHIGYKDVRQIEQWCAASQLRQLITQPMPANNLAFIARKSGL